MSESNANTPPQGGHGQMLPYETPTGGTAIVARCGNIAEAEMFGAALAGAGIPYDVLSVHGSALNYGALSTQVELQVAAEHAALARELIAQQAGMNDDDLEPVEEGPSMAVPRDAAARPVRLVVAAAYETPRAMRDASTVLAAARVPIFPTPVAPRGDRPRGHGPRFAVRVAEEDLVRARRALTAADEDHDEEGDPRCPKCGAFRVHAVGEGCLASLLGFGTKSADYQCLACGHRGTRADFGARDDDD